MHLPDTVAMLMCQLRAGLRHDSCMYFHICFTLTNHLFLNNQFLNLTSLVSKSDFISF